MEKVLEFVGDLASFVRLFCQTSKALRELGETHDSLWRCVHSARVVCPTSDCDLTRASFSLLRKCAPSLRKLVVRRGVEPDYAYGEEVVWLTFLLRETKVLCELVFTPAREGDETTLDYMEPSPPLPTARGALPALESSDIHQLPLAKFERAEREELWWPIFTRLRTLTISPVTLDANHWLGEALRPPAVAGRGPEAPRRPAAQTDGVPCSETCT